MNWRDRITGVQDLLEAAMARIREVTRLLNPTSVDRSGLRFALEYLMEETDSRPDCTITLDYPHLAVPRAAARALYSVASGCLTHACASGTNSIQIFVKKRAFLWILEVQYDAPFQSSEQLNMSDRARLLQLQYRAISFGAEIVFTEKSGGGTIISAAYSDEDRSFIPSAEQL